MSYKWFDKTTRWVCAAALYTLLSVAAAQEQRPMAMEALGEVHFPVSCGPDIQANFDRGVALLHHMMYLQAEQVFAEVAEAHPDCAMAHWGIAMTLFHPVWAGQPTQPDIERGRSAIDLAASLGAPTERERAYITATSAFYRDDEADYRARLADFANAMQQVFEGYPEDLDAASLYALMLIATAPSTDKTLSKQREAAQILDRVREAAPSHPGAIHYAIHAHDLPMLAAQAEAIARSYDRIAPEVPHALHMPSHIFVRLGEWPDVIDWNIRSARAALDLAGSGTISNHYPHAVDYLVYAYLQRAADDEAKAVIDAALARTNYQSDFGTAYALAAIPARYALETRSWAEASQLVARQPEQIPWDNYPEVEAIVHFARGLGSARLGDPDAAAAALESFSDLHARTAGYWSTRLQVEELALEGWIAKAQGDADEAVRLLTEATELEVATEKHPVTPGDVLPAAELLGDLLLDLGRPEEALKAYRASLELNPNRLNSLVGAVYAAQSARDPAAAAEYADLLLEITDGVDSERARSLRGKVSAELSFAW